MKNLILFIPVAFLLIQCSATSTKRSTGETIDDNVIVVKLRSKYINDKVVKSGQVKIKSWKGVVTLSGVMDNQSTINRAIEIAEQQNGVKEVKAYLVLKDSGLMSDPFADAITTTTETTAQALPATATTTSTQSTPSSKKTIKKNKNRKVIETNLMDNTVTTPLSDDTLKDQNTKTDVKSSTQPTIESTTDFEEIKY